MTRRLVLGSITLALILGVMVAAPSRREAVKASVDRAEARRRQDLDKVIAQHPQIAKPMASYLVRDEQQAGGMVHRGGGYTARTTADGLHFETVGAHLNLRAARLEQGGVSVECGRGTPYSPAFADVRIDRGCLEEQYIFENRRAEQIFRIPQALGSGALRVVVQALTDLCQALLSANEFLYVD